MSSSWPGSLNVDRRIISLSTVHFCLLKCILWRSPLCKSNQLLSPGACIIIIIIIVASCMQAKIQLLRMNESRRSPSPPRDRCSDAKTCNFATASHANRLAKVATKLSQSAIPSPRSPNSPLPRPETDPPVFSPIDAVGPV